MADDKAREVAEQFDNGRCPECGEDEMDGGRCYYCGFHDYDCGLSDCARCTAQSQGDQSK